MKSDFMLQVSLMKTYMTAYSNRHDIEYGMALRRISNPILSHGEMNQMIRDPLPLGHAGPPRY